MIGAIAKLKIKDNELDNFKNELCILTYDGEIPDKSDKNRRRPCPPVITETPET